ncbi:MAG: sugar phosphate nucleotidyltransferase, partial [Candidatus Sumerlaeota bacterium]
MQSVKAIILGGGRGTRLQPLTGERAKPAVGFAGKYRLIDIPISNCINSDIKRIYVLTQFLSASLHRHIMQAYQFDTFSNGVIEILAAEQTHYRDGWFQGTADAVRATLHHTTYYHTDQALILSGDHLYRMDYRELIDYHRAMNADITLAVYPVPRSEASAFGLMRTASDGTVREFVEKPTDENLLNRCLATPGFFRSTRMNNTLDTEFLDTEGKVVSEKEKGSSARECNPENCCLASMGIYLFNTRVLQDIVNNVEGADFEREIIPQALKRFKVVAWPFNGYWKDIGTIRAFYDANVSLAK